MSGILKRFEIDDPFGYFGGTAVVDLTLYNGVDTVPAGPAYSKYADLAQGGAADLFGTDQSPSGALKLRKTGELNVDSIVELQTRADALRAMKGKAGKLFISMADTTSRWTYARCDAVLMPRAAEHTLFLPVDLQFTQLDANWRGEHHGGTDGAAWTFDSGVYFDSGRAFDELTGDSFALTSGSPGTTVVTLINNGNAPIYNVRFRFTSGSAAITKIEIEKVTHLGIYLRYTPTTTTFTTQTTIIDSGTRQVIRDASDPTTRDYAGFERVYPDHFLPQWFVIPVGGTSYNIKIWGGGTGATLAAVYDEAFQ